MPVGDNGLVLYVLYFLMVNDWAEIHGMNLVVVFLSILAALDQLFQVDFLFLGHISAQF